MSEQMQLSLSHVVRNISIFIIKSLHRTYPLLNSFEFMVNQSSFSFAQCLFVDNHRYHFAELADGLLIDRITKNASGLYLCLGQVPLPQRLSTSIYPIMIFVSDPACKTFDNEHIYSISTCSFLGKTRTFRTSSCN